MITPESIIDDLETLANEVPEDAADLGQSLARLLIDILSLYSGRDGSEDDPHHKCLEIFTGMIEKERWKVACLITERDELLAELERIKG